MPATDVVVLGAGVIGTAVAWRCAQRGLSVTVVDPLPGRGAWNTAAGMLAPITELHYTETPLLRLGLNSLARFPAFAAELADESRMPIGFVASGAVMAAWDGADLAALRDLHAFARGLGVDAELLTGRELRATGARARRRTARCAARAGRPAGRPAAAARGARGRLPAARRRLRRIARRRADRLRPCARSAGQRRHGDQHRATSCWPRAVGRSRSRACRRRPVRPCAR